MKIGIYTPYLDTLTGGEIYMLTMAECLSQKNDVSIFWNDNNILNKASEKFNLDLSKVSIEENIFKKKNSFFSKFKKSFNYDKIIYLSDGSVPLLSPGKLIIHFQQPFKKDDISFIEKSKIKQARKIVCNSHFTKSFIDSAFGVESEVIYPPTQEIIKMNKKKENIILAVGRYQPYKNNSDFKKLSFIIDTFKKLRKDYKNWELNIVTSVRDEDKQSFKENIEERSDKSIKVIKNADHRTIEEIYNKAKIYWHAAGFSENIEKYPERAEHFGMSTVESMSVGCVPVVVDLGGQKEIVENGKNGFLWSSEDELLTRTIELINDNNLYKTLSSEAEKTSKNFTKEKFCQDIKKIINS